MHTHTIKHTIFFYAFAVVIGFSIPVMAFSQAPDKQGPVSHWTMDAGEGMVAVDVEGEHDASFDGDLSWVDGIRDGALSFQDGFASTDPTDAFNLRTFSAAMWVKPNSPKQMETFLAIDSTLQSCDDGWALGHSSSQLLFRYCDTGRAEHIIEAAEWNNVSENEWVHVAVVYKDAFEATVYLNGEPVETANVFRLGYAPSSPMIFGADGEEQVGFVGVMDDVRLYNRALTSEQVQELASRSDTAEETDTSAISTAATSSEAAEDSTGADEDTAEETSTSTQDKTQSDETPAEPESAPSLRQLLDQLRSLLERWLQLL